MNYDQTLKQQGAVLMQLKEDMENGVVNADDEAAITAAIPVVVPVKPPAPPTASRPVVAVASVQVDPDYDDDFHSDGNEDDDEADAEQGISHVVCPRLRLIHKIFFVFVCTDEETLAAELRELQEVRDRVALMREWLAGGGMANQGSQSSDVMNQLLQQTLAECGDDTSRFSELLTDKLFGDLKVTSELKHRAGLDAGTGVMY